MAHRQSHAGFRMMAAQFRVRDRLTPPRSVLEEVGLRPGMCVLDYGCGPGSFAIAAAEMVGPRGKVHALDMHPLAIARVRRRRARKRLQNVETILSDCHTGLADSAVDVVLLYDILHDLSEREAVLRELHRVLKPGGLLSVSDHHLRDEELTAQISEHGLFVPLRRGRRTHTFASAKAG